MRSACCWPAGAGAHAGPYEDALAGFTQGSLSDTGEAIDKVIASGNPLAEPVLKALKNAKLMFSAEQKKVYIQTADDKLLDAATGKPFDGKAPDDIDNVIVNNRLRNVIDADLGALTLMSANPDSALQRGAGGVQVARRQRAAQSGQGARQGDRPARQGARWRRRARRSSSPIRKRAPPTRSPPSP